MLKFRPEYFRDHSYIKGDKLILDTTPIENMRKEYGTEAIFAHKVQTTKVFSHLKDTLPENSTEKFKQADLGSLFKEDNWDDFNILEERFFEDGMIFNLWDEDLLNYFNIKETLNDITPPRMKPEKVLTDEDSRMTRARAENIKEKLKGVELPENWFINPVEEFVIDFHMNYSLYPGSNTFIYFMCLLIEPWENLNYYLRFNLEKFLKEANKDDYPIQYLSYFQNFNSKKALFLDEMETILLELKMNGRFNKDLYEFVKDWIKETRKQDYYAINKNENQKTKQGLESLLYEEYRPLVNKIKGEIDSVKPSKMAAFLYALYDLGGLPKDPLNYEGTQLHKCLKNSFGDYGQRTSLYKALSNHSAPDDKLRNNIEYYKKLINTYLEKN